MKKNPPKIFVDYIVRDRINILVNMAKGIKINYDRLLLELTRAMPVIITNGPAGLSGSVKMIGLIPKEEYLGEIVEKLEEYAYGGRKLRLSEIVRILTEEVYVEEKIDPLKLGGLEMGFKHTWTNIKSNRRATLVFFTPPTLSFEVRCKVEIHEDDNDIYKRYLNALHDLYHRPRGIKSNYPAYVFIIEEIYDNSNSRNGFGTRIYP